MGQGGCHRPPSRPPATLEVLHDIEGSPNHRGVRTEIMDDGDRDPGALSKKAERKKLSQNELTM